MKPFFASVMNGFDMRPNDPREWRRNFYANLIQMQPENIPLEGCLDEALQEVTDRMIVQTRWGGVGCLSVDTFFDHTTGLISGEHVLRNLHASTEQDFKFCIALDTKNSEIPFTSMADWRKFWDCCTKYLDDPRYYTKEGKAVVKIISFDHLHKDVVKLCGAFDLVDPLPAATRNARAIKYMLDEARMRTGLDIVFGAGVRADEHWLWQLGESGCKFHWFYNVFDRTYIAGSPRATDYPGLVAVYADVHNWLVRRLSQPVYNQYGTQLMLCGTMGWDSRPCGGFNIGRGLPAQVRDHLAAMFALGEASDIVWAYGLDAWNEHLEGSVLMPTVTHGRTMLGVTRKLRGL